jgi:hypothetical protein
VINSKQRETSLKILGSAQTVIASKSSAIFICALSARRQITIPDSTIISCGHFHDSSNKQAQN